MALTKANKEEKGRKGKRRQTDPDMEARQGSRSTQQEERKRGEKTKIPSYELRDDTNGCPAICRKKK